MEKALAITGVITTEARSKFFLPVGTRKSTALKPSDWSSTSDSDNEPAQGKTRSEEQQSRIKLANGATGDDIDSKSGATEPVCLLASGEENEENKTEPVCSETSVQLEKCPKTLPEATQTLSAPASPWNTTQFGTNLDTEPKELPLRCGLNAQQMAMGEGQMMMGPDDTNRVAVMAVQGVDQCSHLWLEQTDANSVQGGLIN